MVEKRCQKFEIYIYGDFVDMPTILTGDVLRAFRKGCEGMHLFEGVEIAVKKVK